MKNLLAVVLLAGTLTGCITPKSYVDPSFAKATYNDIKAVDKKYESQVQIEFQRNGELLEAVESEVRGHVERTLRASGVITPNKDANFTLKVTINNLADMGEAFTKGFGTGLTFGAAGSTVTDYYEIEIVYTAEDGKVTTNNYKHALHTTIGNADAPIEGVPETTIAAGFGTIVEQTILNFIADMQKQGELTFIVKPNATIS